MFLEVVVEGPGPEGPGDPSHPAADLSQAQDPEGHLIELPPADALASQRAPGPGINRFRQSKGRSDRRQQHAKDEFHHRLGVGFRGVHDLDATAPAGCDIDVGSVQLIATVRSIVNRLIEVEL